MRSFLLTICLAGNFVASLRATEPLDSRRIPELIKELNGNDPQRRADAAIELEKFGPEAKSAVSSLISLLSDNTELKTKYGLPTLVSDQAGDALAAIGSESVSRLTEALGQPSTEVRSLAVRILRRIGPKAKPALPAILKAAANTDFDIRREVAETLPRIDDLGDESVPLLVEWMQVEEISVRKDAATALGAYRRHSDKSVPHLLKMLKDKDPSVRGCAAQSLGRLAQSPEVVIPALIALLDDRAHYEDWYISPMCAFSQQRIVSGDAAQALRAFGEEALKIGSAFVDAFPADQQTLFPFGFAIAIGQYGPESKAFVPKLTARLEVSELGLRRIGTLTVLNRLGPPAAAAVPVVRKLFREPPREDDPDGEFQIAAACALVSMDLAGNPDAWTRLVAVIDSFRTEDGVRDLSFDSNAELIFETLGRLGSRAKPAVPKLVELLNISLDKNSGSVEIAAVLGKIGPEANAAAPALVKQLMWSDESDEYGDEPRTRTALMHVGPTVLPALVEGLAKFSDDDDHCVRILEVIGQFAGKADSVVGSLVHFCRDERREVRAAAAQTLGQIRGSPEIVVPELLRLLKDDRPLVRERAALSLAAFKAAAGPAISALTTALKDEYIDVRAAAAESLGNLGPPARMAVPALKNMLADPSPSVQAAAATALEKMK